MNIDPQDPRLTAYVLGELADAERAAVEHLLATSPAAQALVIELQETSAALFAALQSESRTVVQPNFGLHAAIDAALQQEQSDAVFRATAQPVSAKSVPVPPRLTPNGGRQGGISAAVACGATVAALAVALGLALSGSPKSAATNSLADVDLSQFSDLETSLAVTEFQPLYTKDPALGIALWDEQTHAQKSQQTEEVIRQLQGQVQKAEQEGQPNELLSRGTAGVEGVVSADQSVRLRFAIPVQSVEERGGNQPVGVEEFMEEQRGLNSAGFSRQKTPATVDAGVDDLSVFESLESALSPLSKAAGASVVPAYDRPMYHRNDPASSAAGAAGRFYFSELDIEPGVDGTDSMTGEAKFLYGYDASAYPAVSNSSWFANDGLRTDVELQVLDRERFLGREESLTQLSESGREQSSSFALSIVDSRLSPENTRRLSSLARHRDDGMPAPGSNEAYAPVIENDFAKPEDQRYSTFSIDVDTAAYANSRRFLQLNQWPPVNSVRLEEFINAFDYDLPQPQGKDPFTVTLDAAACPWQPEHQLVRVALQSRDLPRDDRPATSLVFLIDVSGSMSDENKLPLAQQAMQLLAKEMTENDRIAIVTYADEAQVVLASTHGLNQEVIQQAITSLKADGSTNGAGGLTRAYEVARQGFIEGGANRVLLCTDGDFNVGPSEDAAVFNLIAEQRQSGVFLSVLGFGTGNLKDSKLEGLADQGNGHYSYLDSIKEARRVLIEELTSTLYVVAKDVKLQVEFNPNQVAKYRLLGYENRALAAQDFNNDAVDAGELGAGHRVTALYEVVPTGAATPQGAVDPPRYGPATRQQADVEKRGKQARDALPQGAEFLFVKVRYKEPTLNESVKLEFPYVRQADAAASTDLRFAAAVAEFGLLLRDSRFKGQGSWDQLVTLTRDSLGDDKHGRRTEFLDLVLRARGLYRQAHGEQPASVAPVQLGSLDGRTKAACSGKYRDLLDKWDAAADAGAFSDFYELGYRAAGQHGDRAGLPAGYWVYVHPSWYIWGEKTE